MTVHVDPDRCAACGGCTGICPVGALVLGETRLDVDASCTACGVCVAACPMAAWSLDASTERPLSLPHHTGYDVIVVGAGRVAAEAIAAGRATVARLSEYGSDWMAQTGRRLERNYRLRQRFPPDRRHSRHFVRVCAVAAAGK